MTAAAGTVGAVATPAGIGLGVVLSLPNIQRLPLTSITSTWNGAAGAPECVVEAEVAEMEEFLAAQ
jgi:hypothetical protein